MSLFTRVRQLFAVAPPTKSEASGLMNPGEQRLRWFRNNETMIAAEIRAILGAFTPHLVGMRERLLMRNDADVAFALAILRAPIVNLNWSIETEDEEVALFAETILRPLYRDLALAGSMAIHFGNVIIGKDWEVRNVDVTVTDDETGIKAKKRYPNAMVFSDFKNIDPRTVQILIDPVLDRWGGVEQSQTGGEPIRVGREKVFLWVFRRQEAYGKLCGYPMSDQAYDNWYAKNALRHCRNKYMEKRADPPWKAYVPNEVQKGGNPSDGFNYAHEQLASVKGGGSLVFPNTRDQSGNREFEAELIMDDKRGDMFQQAIDSEGTQILRAYWITDKAGTSDGSGSLAMAEQHAKTMAVSLQGILNEWIDQINNQVLEPLIEMNFGKERMEAAGAKIVGAGIGPEMQQLFKELLLNLLQVEQLQADGSRISFFDRVDAIAVAEQLGIPLKSEDEVANTSKAGAKTDEEALTDTLTKPGEAAPPTPGDPNVPIPSPQQIKTTQDAVLNGAQISAAKDIVMAVVSGDIPEDSALGMLEILFNLSSDQAKKILGSAKKDEEKSKPQPPPMLPGTGKPSVEGDPPTRTGKQDNPAPAVPPK